MCIAVTVINKTKCHRKISNLNFLVIIFEPDLEGKVPTNCVVSFKNQGGSPVEIYRV